MPDQNQNETLTKRQIASRENGKLGGPKTPEGRRRSSANSTKHGLYARYTPVLSNEEVDQYNLLCNRLLEHHQPCGAQEQEIVSQLIDVVWRYHRYARMQEWMIEGAMAGMRAKLDAGFPNGLAPEVRAAVAFAESMTKPHGAFRELTRMLNCFQRTQQRLLNLLKDLQGDRYNQGAKTAPPQNKIEENEPRSPIDATDDPAFPQAWTPAFDVNSPTELPEFFGTATPQAQLRRMAA